MQQRSELVTLGNWRSLIGLVALASACSASGPTEPQDTHQTLAQPGSGAQAAVTTAVDLVRAHPAVKSALASRAGTWLTANAGFRTSWEAGLATELPGQAGEPISLALGKRHELTLSLIANGARASAPEHVDGRVVYPDAYPATDAILVATPARLEEFLLLRSADAPSEFSWELAQPDWVARVESGADGIAFFAKDGGMVLHIPPAWAWDAQGVRHKAILEWTGSGIRVQLDHAGLSYPVLLDPLLEAFVWEDATATSTPPPAREQYAMAFDSAAGKGVLFGGNASGVKQLDTWLWNGAAGTWSEACANPATCGAATLTARVSHAMAYDSGRSVTVLFGGFATVRVNQTFEWSGTTWTERCTACTDGTTRPSPRSGSSMAYDAAHARTVLFGGQPSSSAYLDETWLWDGAGNAWTQVCAGSCTSGTTKPPPRTLAAMADEGGGKVLLFGGNVLTNPSPLTTAYGSDTWEWDGATNQWTQLCVGCMDGVSRPSARLGPVMAFDSTRNRVVLFGGQDASFNTPNDTWEWNPATSKWAKITPSNTPPPGRFNTAMFFDSVNGRLVLFGGTDGATDLSDTWLYHSHGGGNSSGAPCTASSQCDTGICKDGVCCETACAGSCMRCDDNTGGNKPGICVSVVNADDADTCTTTKTCNAAGVCKLKTGQSSCGTDGTLCATGFCVDGVCCADACNTACLSCTAGTGACSTNIALGATDSNSTPPCAAPNACDGAGSCKTATGQTGCTMGSQCASGFCADGVCCVNGCTTECKSCASGSGACTANVAKGSTDTNSTTQCTGNDVCDGAGNCKLKNGQTCSLGSDCASGNCIDGTCCTDGCTTECKSCANSTGTCTSNVAVGVQDTNSSTQCTGNNACDGAGSCKPKQGQSGCTADAQCATGHCVDGTCCADTCTTACKSCANAAGTCTTNVAAGAQDAVPAAECTGTSSCDGAGNCKKANAQGCSVDGDCANGHCIESVCCDTVCGSACDSCTVSGKVGKCSPMTLGSTGTPSCAPYACNGTAVGCPATCTKNQECAPDHFCSAGGTCNADKPIGSSCKSSEECQGNTNCVDGVCCNSGCTNACQACSAALKGGGMDGTCDNVASGLPPHVTAGCSTGTTQCDPDGLCDGMGACRTNAPAGHACGVTACSNGTINGSTCDGQGNCQTSSTVSCEPFLCKAGTDVCGDSCTAATETTDCAATAYCGSGICITKKDNGSGCGGDNECANGHCVAGICCESACTDPCATCGLGLCKAAAIGTATCPNDFVCDGTSTSCPTLCNSNANCIGTDFCQTSSNTCVKRTTGSSCMNDDECPTNHCADGVCCDTACKGQCEQCNSSGTCVATTGDPAPGHSACTGDPACRGTCDGTDRTACTAPKDSSTSCASTCGAGIHHSGTCNATSGACMTTDNACDPYVCDDAGVSCKTACTVSSDCKVGFVCTAGQCVAPISAGVCSSDNTKATPVGGTEMDCAPYLCKAGACLRNCTSSSDCQGDGVCDGAQCTSLTALNAPASADKGGCGCRVAGAGTERSGSALLGLGALAFASLARRRRRLAAA